MENASKALIIAGAILISILIIGLGVFIYNKAKGAMDDSIDLDTQKIESVNSKFEAYEGKISGSDAKALIDAVRAYNNTYGSTDKRDIAIKPESMTGVTGIGTANTAAGLDITTGLDGYSKLKSAISVGGHYDISFQYYGEKAPAPGYIAEVKIKQL